MKIYQQLIIAALVAPLLYACSEYRSAGYASARVHVKNAPAALERQTKPAPAAPPAPQVVSTPPAPQAAPAPAPAPAAQPPRIAQQVVPAQEPIPEKLLAPLPQETPAAKAVSAPAPTAQAAPKTKRDYPIMPGQNRRLKAR